MYDGTSSSLPTAHAVVVVDDNPDMRDALDAALTAHGMSVVSAADGRELMSRVREGFRPCVVLFDVRRPVRTAWDHLERLRVERALAAVPVIVMSTSDDQSRPAKASGCSFLLKPFDAKAVVTAIRGQCRLH
jgi:CheY-like chemotaxis protein